jgi:hypothetical protein
MYAWTPRVSFPFESPPKSVSKGARFWGFLRFRVRGILGGNPSIPLDLAIFGGPNHGYGMPMRYSYYPQSLVQIRGANREIGIWIWRSWPSSCCSSRALKFWPVWPVPTPCWVLIGWTFWWVRLSFGLLLFRVWVFWSSGGWYLGFGISRLGLVWLVSCTGLTGVGAFLWKSSSLAGVTRCVSGGCRVIRPWPVWPVWSVAAQVACSVAFSSRFQWLLVPRTSSTSVVTWSWPTCVVESETCFDQSCSSYWSRYLLREEFLSAPIHSPLSGR